MSITDIIHHFVKILILSYNFPYPPTGGSIIRDYNLFRHLSMYHELYWIVVSRKENIKDEHIREMEKYFKKIHIVGLNTKHSVLDYVKSLFVSKPYIFNRFDIEEISIKSREYVDKHNIDLFFCDHIYLAQNIPQGIENQIPVIPNNEDHAFTYYYRLANSGDFLRSIYAYFQWRKILKFEIDIYKKYGADITTSEKEKDLLLEHDNSLKIEVVPNGVDLNFYTPCERTDFTQNVVFVAWYRYYPNEKAVLDFVKNVFPFVKKVIPEFKFYVVGKETPKSFERLKNVDGVIITGEVDDVRPFLVNSDAVVIPLQVGGGTRLKILEAMAMGRPVISTPVGAEGLNATNNENILIANDDKTFADLIVKIINDRELSYKISINGRLFVEENYGWKEIGNKLNQIIQDNFAYFKKNNK